MLTVPAAVTLLVNRTRLALTMLEAVVPAGRAVRSN
jgi:hypothetical protein